MWDTADADQALASALETVRGNPQAYPYIQTKLEELARIVTARPLDGQVKLWYDIVWLGWCQIRQALYPEIQQNSTPPLPPGDRDNR